MNTDANWKILATTVIPIGALKARPANCKILATTVILVGAPKARPWRGSQTVVLVLAMTATSLEKTIDSREIVLSSPHGDENGERLAHVLSDLFKGMSVRVKPYYAYRYLGSMYSPLYDDEDWLSCQSRD